MDKKGYGGDVVLWIVRIIITMLVVSIIVFVVNSSVGSSIKLYDVRFYPVAERYLYSPSCFVMVKQDRAYPGTLVYDRFNQEQLDGCMAPLDESIGSRVTLTYRGEEMVLYHNKDYFEDIVPLAFSQKYNKQDQRYYVLVERDGNITPASLYVEVAWRI